VGWIGSGIWVSSIFQKILHLVGWIGSGVWVSACQFLNFFLLGIISGEEYFQGGGYFMDTVHFAMVHHVTVRQKQVIT